MVNSTTMCTVASVYPLSCGFTVLICFSFNMRIEFSSMTCRHTRRGSADAVRRLSTQSWGSMTYKNKPFVTEWLWYWLDEHDTWRLYEDSEAIEEAFIDKQQTYSFTIDATGFSYELDFDGKRSAIKILLYCLSCYIVC